MEALYQMRAVSIFRVLITVIGAMGLMGLGLSIVGLYGLVAYAVEPADPGNRHPDGGRRGQRGSVADGPATGPRARARGAGRWSAGERRRGAIAPGGVPDAATIRPTSSRCSWSSPIVLAVTFLAAYVPARQASRVDPILALRHE